MTDTPLLDRLVRHDGINFTVTNRIPRALATRLMGRLSRIESPLLTRSCLAVWRLFAGGLDLDEAKERRFRSLHDCFVRELKEDARPVDPDPRTVVSPCDAVVGACGAVQGARAFQAKGSAYPLHDLLLDPELVLAHEGGTYATLRLKSTMYHRFHAPHDCVVDRVTYVAGDTWNVNPPALRRVEGLFARNERAVLSTRLTAGGHRLTLVPVAAILVASLRLHFLDLLLHLDYHGPAVLPCEARLEKGEEMGWFQHGSTILVFAAPGLELCPGVQEGALIRMGRPLLRIAEGAGRA
jgi:phosphatidylserine decarboxylase